MNNIEHHFLRVLKASLYGENISITDENINDGQFFQLARFQNVLPLVLESLSGGRKETASANPYSDDSLSNSDYKKASDYSVNQVLTQICRLDDFLRLYQFLKKSQLEPVLAGGLAVSCCYPWPYHRIYKDELLLIEKDKALLYHKALLDWGLKQVFPDQDIEKEDEIHYKEPHSKLYIKIRKRLFLPEEGIFDDLCPSFEDVMEKKVKIRTYMPADNKQLDPEYISCINPSHQFQDLFCRTLKFYPGPGFTISHICDLLIYGETYFQDIDWDYIRKVIQESQGEKLFSLILATGVKYLLKEDARMTSLSAEWRTDQKELDSFLENIFEDSLYRINKNYEKTYHKPFKNVMRKIAAGPLSGLGRLIWSSISEFQRCYYNIKWMIQGYKKPDREEIAFVRENVTFIYKSFNRQNLARGLYRNIQSMYPGVRVIIADDSQVPLEIQEKQDHLEIIHLPFNSGLSKGLKKALARVKTPYVMKLDDDMVLTRHTQIGSQLDFLIHHPEIDLVSFGYITTIRCLPAQKVWETYYAITMDEVADRLKLPHLYKIDESHVVLAKGPNIFLARTDKLRQLGYDEKIRMLDHAELFHRAAGVLTTVGALDTILLHRHNMFNPSYEAYRSDFHGDIEYIKEKHKDSL